MSKVITIIILFAVVAAGGALMLEFNKKSSRLTPAPEQLGGFCGVSTRSACSSNADCTIDGCSGQICRSKTDGSMLGACDYKECYDPLSYRVRCDCIENVCQWGK